LAAVQRSVESVNHSESLVCTITRKILQAATSRWIADIARANSKLRLRHHEVSDVGVALCIGFRDTKAIAEERIVKCFLHTDLGSQLRFEDDGVVVVKIDDITIRVVAEIVTPPFAAPFPRTLEVMGDGSGRDFGVQNPVDWASMPIWKRSLTIGWSAAFRHNDLFELCGDMEVGKLSSCALIPIKPFHLATKVSLLIARHRACLAQAARPIVFSKEEKWLSATSDFALANPKTMATSFGWLAVLLRKLPAGFPQEAHLFVEIAAVFAHHQVKAQAHFLQHAKLLIHSLRHQSHCLLTIQHLGSPS
jgi:hypothetical protein